MGRVAIQAVTLATIAGIADAVGYLNMGGVFAANMTGNTVLAGIAAAQKDLTGTWHHLAPLAAFFAGAMLSRLLLRLTGRAAPGLIAEAVLMASLGFLPVARELQVLALAVAMGLQASAVTQFNGVTLSTVVVTSTLARTADGLLDWLAGGPAKPALPAVARPWLLASTLISYLIGAIAGALLVALVAWPLLVPAALLALLLLVARP